MKFKGESGEHLCTNGPYEYQKDLENEKLCIVDEEAAALVKRIFALRLDGYEPTQIARILKSDKILTPSLLATCKTEKRHSRSYAVSRKQSMLFYACRPKDSFFNTPNGNRTHN